jgi:anti-sigma factor RsiW
MKSHDEFRELAALRVYGELDARERERLARHLSGCAECSALARDLEAGLGRLVPAERRDALPTTWRAGLEAAIVAEPLWAARLPSRWWTAAASFVLGATLAWSVASSIEPSGRPASGRASAAAEPSAFERATPPPRAREGASLPPLAELYLRR